MASPPEIPHGPLPLEQRSIAPDLARGLALLGIALANGPTLLWGRPVGPGQRVVASSGLDRAVDLGVALLVDNRAYPLFALLLGYGTWQVVARRAGPDVRSANPLVVRRALGLLLLGALHAALLFSGDVLGLYGLLLVALSLLLSLRDRVLLVVAAAMVLPLAGLSALDGSAGGDPGADPTSQSGLVTAATWLPSVADRLVVWLTGLVVGPVVGIGLLTTMLVGVVLARHHVLERPDEHRLLLRRLAVSGTLVSVVGGLPFALVVGGVGGVADPVAPLPLLATLHGVTGAAGGIGYVALFALVAARRERPRRRPVRYALVATGRRSLSAYLAQSVLLVPLLAPWALGLGDDVSAVQLAALGVGAWLVTVAGCVLAEASGRRGPAEVLLRRLTYGRAHPTERQGRARSSAT